MRTFSVLLPLAAAGCRWLPLRQHTVPLLEGTL